MTRIATLGTAAILLLLLGCGSSATSTATSATTDCSVEGQDSQILAVMQSWYYWYQSLPASVDPSAYSSSEAFLDALREQPLDRFSYLTTQAADQAFYGAGQYVGFGFGSELTSSNDLQVTQVFPASPAAQAGLARGDTVTGLNGTPVPTLVASGQLDAALSVSGPGTSLGIAFTDLAGVSHSTTLVSAVVTQPSVAITTTLEQGGTKVGYVLFNSFIDTSTALLDQAFGQFRGEGVTELVMDERYNGGGEVSVAQHLGSLILGNGYSGKTMGVLTFNDKHADQNQTELFQTVTNPLNLTRVVFITTQSTASASEFTINGLVPYLHVVTVGSATFGKPVGEQGFNICANVLYPITFKITNAVGYGDYFDGLPATCPAPDDLTHPLGDPREASLAAALAYLERGGCGSASPERAVREGLRPRRPMRYTFRQLVNAY